MTTHTHTRTLRRIARRQRTRAVRPPTRLRYWYANGEVERLEVCTTHRPRWLCVQGDLDSPASRAHDYEHVSV